jgi:hypothetical protein
MLAAMEVTTQRAGAMDFVKVYGSIMGINVFIIALSILNVASRR